jgi:potassium-dependent mechanosensitive channel
MKLYSIPLILSLLFTATISWSQPASKQVSKKDSIRTQEKPVEHKKSVSTFLSKDTLSLSDYVISIERVNDKLNAIRDSSKLPFEVVRISRKSSQIAQDIGIIRQNVRGRNTELNVRNLYLYQNLASNLDEQNTTLQEKIDFLYQQCYRAKLHLKTAMSDSVFSRLYSDPAIRSKVKDKVIRVERRWNKTDSLTRQSIDSLNAIKIRLADNCINLTSILNITDFRLDRATQQLFGRETKPLWMALSTSSAEKEIVPKNMNILDSELKAISYYFTQSAGNRFLIFVFGFFMFYWLFRKRALFRKIKLQEVTFTNLPIKYLGPGPVWSILLVILCLMPFFDAYAPSSYISIQHFLLLSVATFIFIARKNYVLFPEWLILAGLFVLCAFTNLLSGPGFFERIWLIGLHVACIVFTYRFYRKIPKKSEYALWIRRTSILGLFLFALAILSNLLGRFSLSGIFGIAGIFSVTHAIILPVFIEILIEVVLVQILNSRFKKGLSTSFNASEVIRKMKNFLWVIAILLWLIMLASNLNVYHRISNQISDFLSESRSIGSISFKLISVTWFFAIIWLAHILQRLVSYIFGETGSDGEDSSEIPKEKHSRLLIMRLLVLIGGYLLAIAASGLPIDKLTFVLGALGVGIGMGLQNVVNNFVSGIILIFDGSLKIGDQIEISGQAGRVKEIGLRSSTLATADGADVIIPNGSILSQNITNWTYSNDEKRVVILFSVSGKELDANLINEVINSTILSIPHIVTKRKPVILYTKVTPETCWLTVRFWSIINKVDEVKSESMLRLNEAFTQKGLMYK